MTLKSSSKRVPSVIDFFDFHLVMQFSMGWENGHLHEIGPPEDCGGPSGYMEMCEILKDPSHPEYEEMMERAPEGFSPTNWDMDAVNRRLARLSKRLR